MTRAATLQLFDHFNKFINAHYENLLVDANVYIKTYHASKFVFGLAD